MEEPIGALLMGIIGVALVVLIYVAVVRWVFRINTQIKLLTEIKDKLKELVIQTKAGLRSLPCESCGKFFDPMDMQIIDSGQKLCRLCYKNLKK